MWYLSELMLGFGFFDEGVSVEEKQLMVLALTKNVGSEKPPKCTKPFLEPETKGRHDFVTTSTSRFFRILGLPEDFMQKDPSEWEQHQDYIKNKALVRWIKVVNDLAERGVALMQEFSGSLTRNEEQKHYLLQLVESHRRQFAAPTKAGAIKQSTSVTHIECE